MMKNIWPPTYTLKKHARAKHVKFRICEKNGLVITVPKRFKASDLPAILETHRAWILKKLPTHFNQTINLPSQIELTYINAVWQVEYQALKNSRTTLIELPQRLVILGNLSQPEKIRGLLLAWLKKVTYPIFFAALNDLSKLTTLSFTKLSIRQQRTQWGSCNQQKEISLNLKLLFLNKSLANHVMLHELVHTKYLNHSKKFWHLLATYDTKCSEHKKDLRQAQKNIPLWLDHTLLAVPQLVDGSG